MRRKILIVDDNSINRQLLIHTLENDYDIIEAGDGAEAISSIQKNYKLLSAVLLDIFMPGVDGYEVLKKVKKNVLFTQIPIIVVTSSDDEETRLKALSFGANDFIQKPYNPEIVKHILHNNIQLRETASILNVIQRDKLTGLLTREAFFEKAAKMYQEKEPGYYTLSAFDVDNFKFINEQYGAQMGDKVLKDIARIVDENSEKMDGIAGRISADNFVMMYPTTHKHTDLLEMNKHSIKLADEVQLNFSIGRYVINDFNVPTSSMYDRAYLAKQSVKNRYDSHICYFDDEMMRNITREQEIVLEMEDALKGHQFEVWFQPQHNHETKALVGAEALVRWRHPKKGLVSPSYFIPLFEENGFIYELDKYVWRETARHIREWLDEGKPVVKVSVNISRYDIFRVDLVNVILDIVKEFDIPIELFCLEITESVFSETGEKITQIIEELSAHGFIIEIDDFGSGYSSLNTLKNIPANIIKLDMRFFESAKDMHRSGTIIESMIRMVKLLGMGIIAEGVETLEQADYLASIGCSVIQGYLYSRPLPSEDYEVYFDRHDKDKYEYEIITDAHLKKDLFWDPNSLDTLIFNSYVGAACVFEISNNRLSLIRSTDKFAKLFDSENMTVEKLMKLNLETYLDYELVLSSFKELDDSKGIENEYSKIFKLHGIEECREYIYLKINYKTIARTSDRTLIYCLGEDVTDQEINKKKSEQLRRHLFSILAGVFSGITAIDMSTRKILYANDNYYDIIGYTSEEQRKQIDDNPLLTLYEPDKEYVFDKMNETMESRTNAVLEYRIIRSDKEIRWVRSLISMVSFEGVGEKVQLATFVDITDEVNKSTSLLDNIPCGAFICHLNTKTNDASIVMANKRFYDFFNYRKGQRRGESIFSVIHPDDVDVLKRAMEPALTIGGQGSCVIRIKDGDDYIWFKVMGIATNAKEEFNEIYTIVLPLDNDNLAVQELLPFIFGRMMQLSPRVVFIKDINYKYVTASQKFVSMVGFDTNSQIIGKTDDEVFEKKTADILQQEDKEILTKEREFIDKEEYLPLLNGEVKRFKTSKYPITDAKGNVIGIFGASSDITNESYAQETNTFLLNNIPGGVAVYEGMIEKDGKINIKPTFFSDGLCSMGGFSREEYIKLTEMDAFKFVDKKYLPSLKEKLVELIVNGKPLDYTYLLHGKEADNWVYAKAIVANRMEDKVVIYIVFFNVTEDYVNQHKLKLSEKELQIALKQSKGSIYRYDIAQKRLTALSMNRLVEEEREVTENVPESIIKGGKIAVDSRDTFVKFFNDINQGNKEVEMLYQRLTKFGYRWIKGKATLIQDEDNEPRSAIISFSDYTDSIEKDINYQKWQQSLTNKDSKNYSLYRGSISKNVMYDIFQGELLQVRFYKNETSFDVRTKKYINQFVYEEDKQQLFDFIKLTNLKEQFRKGNTTIVIEYRESINDKIRWIRLSIDMIGFKDENDIEAYLLFENIDKEKRKQLEIIQHAENDQLTGLYNRTTFTTKVDKILAASNENNKHALIFVDLDGFKLVNDTFGHSAGDNTLVDIARVMKGLFRKDDLVCRLGGDEFLIFLKDIPDESLVASKAKQLCELCQQSLSVDVSVSASAGIAIYPTNGLTFDALYKCSDEALYYVKETGRSSFAFHQNRMNGKKLIKNNEPVPNKKKKILVVEDNDIDFEVMSNIFSSEFIIERAQDGNDALIKLNHYSHEINLVLLDLFLPKMDGMTVLEKMMLSPITNKIPVVVVSSDTDNATSLTAIRKGACDFVNKPYDHEVMKIRVSSAINKAENERLKDKYRTLDIVNREVEHYKNVLDKLHIGIVELDWESKEYTYNSVVSEELFGNYDDRSLLNIFESDKVSNNETNETIRNTINSIAKTNGKKDDSILCLLKTSKGENKEYEVSFHKVVDGEGQTIKIFMMFRLNT